MSKNFFLLCATVLLFAFVNKAQSQPTRPTPLNNAPTINAFVANCFDLYEKITATRSRVDAVQASVLSKSLIDINVESSLKELGDCGNLLGNLLPAATSLFASIAQVTEKGRAEIGTNPFKILAAMKQIANAGKAIKESQEGITTMLKTTIPGIKGKIKEKGGDTTTAITPPATNGATATQTTETKPVAEATTLLTIENLPYAAVQEVTDALKANEKIKNATKTFGGNKAVLTIIHTGSTDELLDVVMRTSLGKKAEVLELSEGQIKLKVK